jgi:hypothetical protein
VSTVSTTTSTTAHGISAPAFLLRAMLWHTVTYLLAGLVASRVLDYQWAFHEPVIRDYMKDFDAAGVGFGPWLQPIRGLIVGVVLLPFTETLARHKLGWLFLWGLLVGIGILSTSAAAPSSVEGLLYSRVPLWYHLFGLPEVLLQTLAFSVLLHRSLRPHEARSLPPRLQQVMAAVAGACFAFIGYAVVSIAFAFAIGQGFQTEGALTWQTQGLFIMPLLLLAALVFLGRAGLGPFTRPVVVAVAAWGSNALAILAWQALVMNAPGFGYALLAPILPAVITAFMARPRPAPGVNAAGPGA